MFFRKIGALTGAPRREKQPVIVRMPTRIGPDLAETAFVRPLNKTLAEAQLGSVTAFEVYRDSDDEPEAMTLTLDLVSTAPRALERIIAMLEALDAPVGSTLRTAGQNETIAFGISHGLGLYVPMAETDEETRLDLIEVCTDALEGAGLYQGSARLGDRTALYFYGDSFNSMRAAITFVMSHDPRCRNAVARRLT